jgi:hypothetical protein
LGWSSGQGGIKTVLLMPSHRCRSKWKTDCQAARPVA